MLVYLYSALFLPLLLLAAACAWRWGRWPERAVSIAYLLALAGSALSKTGGRTGYFRLEAGLFVVDLALLGFLTWLAVRTRYGWLIWATAFQLLSTSAHFVRLMDSHFRGLAYATLEGASSYPALIALGIGILQSWKRNSRAAGGFSKRF